MNRVTLLAATTGLLAALVAPASAQSISSGAKSDPPIPFADSGACPFEGCVYGVWTARRRVAVRSAPDTSSPISFHVAPGKRVLARTGIVVTTVPGQVRFRDTVTLSGREGSLHIMPSDTLFLLTYEGEGYTTAWFKGRLYRDVDAAMAIFNGICDTEPARCVGRIMVPVRRTWWVEVCELGHVGWTDDSNAFKGQDALGERPRVAAEPRHIYGC